MIKITFLTMSILLSFSAFAAYGMKSDCENPNNFSNSKDLVKGKDVELGKIGKVSVWKVFKNLKEEEEFNSSTKASDDNCINIEFRSKNQVTILNIQEYGSGIAPEHETISKIAIKKDKIYIDLLPGSRYAEEGEYSTYIYRYNQRSKKISKIGMIEFKPHTQMQNRVYKHFQKAKNPKALKLVIKEMNELNSDPNGWQNLRKYFFQRYSPVFLKKLKAFHKTYSKAELSGVALSFAKAILADSSDEKINITSISYENLALAPNESDVPDAEDAKIWKQLAGYMIREGQKDEGESIEYLLEWKN
jgi:hypothetical protein